MKENKNILEEPAVSYGSKVRLGDIEFRPMPHLMETLRERGYITLDELSERLSKYLWHETELSWDRGSVTFFSIVRPWYLRVYAIESIQWKFASSGLFKDLL